VSDPYQFVILDCGYEEGTEIAAAIRSDATLNRPLILALTSMASRSDWKSREPELVDASLVKPVRQSRLMSVLAECWDCRFRVEPREPRQAKPPADELKPLGDTPPLRVLVAEDNPVNQRVAIRMLERLRLRVDIAADGREAVEMAQMLSYDLILMDCQMPGMDGYEATQEIRARERGGTRIPILAMTAEGISGCKEACLAAGMDDFITKPVTLRKLGEVIQKWAGLSVSVTAED
jgi:two-component system, sensor histidine kinase and response regulator